MDPSARYHYLQQLPARKIAVWRPLKLGDFLVSVPALRALRQVFPRAVIDYIGLPWAAEIVPHFAAYIDGFVEFPGIPGILERPWQAPASVQFLAGMQRRGYDLLLQMHGNGSVMNYFAPLCGAKVTAGFAAPHAYWPNRDWFMRYPTNRPEVNRLLALMQFLGMSAADARLEFPVTEGDQLELLRLPGIHHLSQSYAVLHVGAVSSRPWPAEHFAEVGDKCARLGLNIILTGTADEAPLAQEVVGLMRAPANVLAGKTSLGSLGALIAGAQLFVGNDTGPSHMAVALDTPSVTIFSTADPLRWAPLDAARHQIVLAAEAQPRHVMQKIKAVAMP
jgi:ADP-heptose:LPS heptosyltransferase